MPVPAGRQLPCVHSRLLPGSFGASPKLQLQLLQQPLPPTLSCHGDPAKMGHSCCWWPRHQAQAAVSGREHPAPDCHLCLQKCQVPRCCAEADTRHSGVVVNGRPASVAKLSLVAAPGTIWHACARWAAHSSLRLGTACVKFRSLRPSLLTRVSAMNHTITEALPQAYGCSWAS